ncbi:MAG TPA: small ribosomal subunit Rsm22 family protein [Phycicoccus sp.]|nr:small ribosomal subunit Rsm22 family protein [Phycicoccus sp.]
MDLTDALAAQIRQADTPASRAAAERLREIYRSGAAPTELALATQESALAYGAYRMPATYAAVRAALSMSPHEVLQSQAPATHLDLGGGTGAAVWAVHELWPEVTSRVFDASEVALDLGRRVAARGDGQVASTSWERAHLGPTTILPSADLVTISYLLGELADATAAHLVDEALDKASLLLAIEPGTPRGHSAILAARARVIEAGWHLLAPCPHAHACPAVAPDWCHFAVRLPRSATHRALKGAERGFEDEKFSFVLAARSDDSQRGESGPAPARVVRHPLQRKGLVQVRTCENDGLLHDRIVSKRQGEAYRRARDLTWGDTLNP